MNGVCLPSQQKIRLSSVIIAIGQVQGRIFFIGKVVAVVLGVNSGCILKLVQLVSGDIYKFIERWDLNVLVCEVGDDSECSNRAIED